MKRIFAALLLIIMVFALASCGNEKPAEVTTAATEKETSESETPRVEKFDITYDDEMVVGATQQLKVDVVLTGSWPDIAPEKRFESSDESVLTVDQNGLVIAVSKGTAEITVRERTLEKKITINIFEGPVPLSKHAETPTATVLIDTKPYKPYHEMAVSEIGGVIGDGYDIFKSDYLPPVDKVEFVHFCRDSEIWIFATVMPPIQSVMVYNAETGERVMPDDTQLKYELSALGSLDYGRYILKFYVTDRGNGAFANDYITEVFFIGIEITDDIPREDPGGYLVYKPVVYLYPTEPTDVTVKYVNEENLLTTYPKYSGAWRVRANIDGTLTDDGGRQYYALFFDEARTYGVDFSSGFYVTAENAIPFLEEKLALLGFTEREANEFIMFWLPVLEKNGQSVVYFEQTAERDKNCPLDVSPAPESVLRVIIHIKKVAAPVEIEAQQIVPFERRGFTVVEWGGTAY